MANALRTALSVSTGRYWWVLVVRDCANGGVAHIVRVLRGRGAGHSYVDLSCSGSFEVCRRFQTANGGSADGVLLVDDATPVKMVQVGDEELKRENFECVTSIDGDYAVVALRRSFEDLADEVVKAGFGILVHLPALVFETEMLRSKDLSGEKLFWNVGDGVAKSWYFEQGEFLWASKVVGECVSGDGTDVAEYVKKRFFQGAVQVEDFNPDVAEIARSVAEDAWLFRTDHLPAFSTLPDSVAVARIREAALFRRTFKACVGILLASLLVTLAFWGGVSWYVAKTETQVAAIEKNIETRKELERVWKKLEAEKAGTEEFLSHRSRMSTFLNIIAADLPADSWITHWSVNRNVHSLQGYSASSEEVSKFLSTLEHEKRLVNVRLRTTEKTTFKRKPVVKFDLTAEVIP